MSFQVFFDELTPYGNWVYHPVYGYAWIPDAGSNFYPYATDGYWVYTWAGWTWVSNYSWGWAPFHYGRWYMDPFYGPMWIPGYEWSPGWVVWRKSGDYYGWAPIGPGVSIYLAYGNSYHVPHDHWRFMKGHHFGNHDQYNYYAQVSQNMEFVNHSTVINTARTDHPTNVPYNSGPERREIERYRGEPVSMVTIQEREKPGQYMDNNKLQLYAPEVQEDLPAGRKAAPSRVVKLEDREGLTRTATDHSQGRKDQTTYRQPERTQEVPEVRNAEPTKQTRQNTVPGSSESQKRSTQTAPSRHADNVKSTPQNVSSRNTGNVKSSLSRPTSAWMRSEF
ncbi:MAG: hypothetical protein KBB71_03605 [Lentimicrobiaceae bacterium]|nr:hypothetical protein [Lentimicrobiaceae bacterium]